MESDLNAFLEALKSPDAERRYAAWRGAGPMGAAAVAPIADLCASPDRGVAKAAKGALENIAHHAARPGAGKEARAVSTELLQVAQSRRPTATRAEALHLLGFTADSRAVPGIAPLLTDTAVRDEARMALERIPGNASLHALKQAAKTAPADFRPALEQSLHNRVLTPKTAGIR
ncbi:MAG TPA: HEAT repeat domain-containing protein [Chthonomonadaceae bacterium]|nr:HEAT repeat domain-containing protein [Chthonomonadaceae bacterium]